MITHITEHIISITCVQCIEEKKKTTDSADTVKKSHPVSFAVYPYRTISLIASYLYNSQVAANRKKILYLNENYSTHALYIIRSITREETGQEMRLIRAHKHIKKKRCDKVRKPRKYIYIIVNSVEMLNNYEISKQQQKKIASSGRSSIGKT